MLVEGIPPPLRLWNSFAREEDIEEEDAVQVQVPPAPEPLKDGATVSESLAWQRSKIEFERRALASVLDDILV
jgi:ferric-dicitrate binding protein FerR (iron transport regulator)